MSKANYECAEYSSLFRAVKGLLYVRGGLAFRVSEINASNVSEGELGNRDRLQSKISYAISSRFLLRINNYKLSFLFPDNKENLHLLKIKSITSNPTKTILDYSGESVIFPKTFVCTTCNDFVTQNKFMNLTKKCRNSGCNGEYKQVSIVKFCEMCGMIDPLYYRCQKNEAHSVELIRPQADDIFTWKFRCSVCKGEMKDILGWPCSHTEQRTGIVYSEEKRKKYKTITVGEGTVFLPVVITMIDLPDSGFIDSKDIDYAALAVSLNLIKDPDDSSVTMTLEGINECYAIYENPRNRKRFGAGLSDSEWAKQCGITGITQAINDAKTMVREQDIGDAIEYFTLTGVLSDQNNNTRFSEFIENINDPIKKKFYNDHYKTRKQQLHIQSINYISSVKLISANIGYIRGTNKFYEIGFVPHFEPNWVDEKTRDKYEAYIFPFETEGVIIRFEASKILDWLNKNNLVVLTDEDLKEPELTLLRLLEEDIIEVKKLLHTISHQLIKISSLYTGMDADSCSEMIFPRNGAIFIYSTSTINIGGFRYLFENAIFEWLENIETAMNDCIYDPMCNNNNGMCFACGYLKEFVCINFNKDLDRDIFLAKKRYKEGFWKYG